MPKSISATRDLNIILNEMKVLVGDTDEEIAHGEADSLLIDTIYSLGRMANKEDIATEIVSEYIKVEKWYA